MGQTSLSSLFAFLLILSIVHDSWCQKQCGVSDDDDGRGPSSTVRAGFWFSQYRLHSPATTIDASLYTHLYYYALSLDDCANSGIAVPPDQVAVLGNFSGTVKSNNPALKTLLSVAADGCQPSFSAMAADAALRAAFIASSLELARANAFDGLDLAWQFPSSPADMANLGLLLEEWRARIGEEAARSSTPSTLLLTMTAYFSNHLFDGPTTDGPDYPTDAISRSLDWVNVLCFGFHRNGNATANDAALFDQTSHFSASYGVTSWLDAGIPPCKLVMGVPVYGRSWILRNKSKNEPGDPVVAEGPRQKMSNQSGLIAYLEIEGFLKDPGTKFVYDSRTATSYFQSGDLWVSYDSPQVVEGKVRFARRSGLLGYFLWPISFDDSNHTVAERASGVWLEERESPGGGGEEESLPEGGAPPPPPPPPAAAGAGSVSASAQRLPLTRCPVVLACGLSCFLSVWLWAYWLWA
ncbi:class V chitinase CHIT5b-like [Curcuma longa]|uniref:class V chitinase CHIT5b-like n=1 Tax=Curcuma longa TaxID=136217 RepID=UPI003D9DFDB7